MLKDNINLYFGSKKERVFRILLSNKNKNCSWYKIAKLAETNYSYVHSILCELERVGALKKHEISDVKKIFNLWANHRSYRYYREYNIQNPKETIKNAKMEYAFTGYFAENLVGNYLFPRYYELYVNDSELEKWHKYLTNSGYVGKGNVKIYFTDQHVFFEKHVVEGWPVVSIQQLIVDLMREGAECGEAAELLMKRIYHA
ncbi:MAG: hypothetical protein WCJ47_02085 [Methanomicrobiales archaeon]